MYDIVLFLAFLSLSLINAMTDFHSLKTSDLISSLLWIVILLLSLDNGTMLSFSFASLVILNTIRQFIGWGDILFLPAHMAFSWYIGGVLAVLVWLLFLGSFSFVFTRTYNISKIPIALPSFVSSALLAVLYWIGI